MLEKYNNARKEDRFPFLKTIGYACDDVSGNVFKGVTINISPSGMCLYLYDNHCIGKDKHITIQSDLPINADRGIIRWVDKIDDGFYKAGLMFVS